MTACKRAVAIGAVLLGEPVTWHLVAGGLVVLAGVSSAENRIRLPRQRVVDTFCPTG